MIVPHETFGEEVSSYARDRRAVISFLAIAALVLALQVGDSAVDHDHPSGADQIECVACHGVRVVAPSSSTVALESLPFRIVSAAAETPEIPPLRVVVDAADRPRGPPST